MYHSEDDRHALAVSKLHNWQWGIIEVIQLFFTELLEGRLWVFFHFCFNKELTCQAKNNP